MKTSGCLLWEFQKKVPVKALGFQWNLMRFRDIRERYFSNWETAICDVGKGYSKTAKNTDVYVCFWRLPAKR